MRLVLAFYAVALLLLAAWPGLAAAQTITVIKPELELEEFYAFPHEGSANKLAGAYTYPNVKNIDVYLRFAAKNMGGEQKAVAFVAMSAGGATLAKSKQKLMVQDGRYEITFPEVLNLAKVFGEKEVTLALQLAVTGATTLSAERTFYVKGRDLPKVEILDFWLGPGYDSGYGDFTPGDVADGVLVFKTTGAQNADTEIRIVGIVDDEGSFSIDPRDDYQRYDAYWDRMDGPRRDGLYMLNFQAYLPRYFYHSGSSRHDFSIYAVFEAEGQIIRMVASRGTIIDYYSGPQREADDDLMRVLQISRSGAWRMRMLRNYAPYDEGARWFDETPQQ